MDNAKKLILCTRPNIYLSHALNILEEIANRFKDLVTLLSLLKLRSSYYPIYVRLNVDKTLYNTLATKRLISYEEQESTSFNSVKIKPKPSLYLKLGKGKGNTKELRALKATYYIRRESPKVIRILYYYDIS